MYARWLIKTKKRLKICLQNISAILISLQCANIHYNDVIMGSMVSQITSLTIVYSAVYSGADQRKYQSSESQAFWAGNSPGTGDFPAQRAGNAENVSIWWRHYALMLNSECSLRVGQLMPWPITRKMFRCHHVNMKMHRTIVAHHRLAMLAGAN